jgi:hypothetical protein
MSGIRTSMLRSGLAAALAAVAAAGVVTIVAEPDPGNPDATTTTTSTTVEPGETPRTPVAPVVELPPQCDDVTIALVVRTANPPAPEAVASARARLDGYLVSLRQLVRGYVGVVSSAPASCEGAEDVQLCEEDPTTSSSSSTPSSSSSTPSSSTALTPVPDQSCVVGVLALGPFDGDGVAGESRARLERSGLLEVDEGDRFGVWRYFDEPLPGTED